jgi:NAD(P)-dependent dehydrogenase (short-subunit alcohol dehydrogenase family)
MRGESFIDFSGKTVIVTGASSGIGRAISIELSRHGASLVLVGRDHTRLMDTASLLGSGFYHIVILDLREHAAILPRVQEVAREAGRLYGLCHSAGIVKTRPLSSSRVEDLKSMLDVNLTSGLELARAVCRRDIMEEQGGSILFISSIYALVGMPGQIAYSATKGAVSAAARSMAVELARRKIRVNTISPGLVPTSMTASALCLLSQEQVTNLEKAHPLGPGRPEDVARAAAFLLAPQSSWITGADLVVDGGFTAQ